MSLPAFHWLSLDPVPPARWDLRLIAWRLAPPVPCARIDGKQPSLLDWRAGSRLADRSRLRHRETIVAVGVDEASERAALLADGYGDAVCANVVMAELAARLLKLEAFATSLPRYRRAGPVPLDLFYRDARLGETWLGLHPREFALLWRLTETPAVPVSRRELLADVWRLEHVPETNSLEVHVSRLRAKLAISHCAWLVRTCPGGGYQLGSEEAANRSAFFGPGSEALDRPVAIGNGAGRSMAAEERGNGERSGCD